MHKYIFIFLILYALFCVGGTYAYYAFQIEEESVITGNVISIDVDLEVELVVGNNTKMVPMLDAALSNAINGVGSDNGPCIDSVGNLSCQVYKITLTNNGSRLKNITGSIELYPKEGTSNAYTNLKWRELTNPTTIKEDSIINGMNKSTLVSDLTIESKEVRIWYIAVWISEVDYDQREIDKGLFGGTVTFEAENGSSSDSTAEIVSIEASVADGYETLSPGTLLYTEIFEVTAIYNNGESKLLNNVSVERNDPVIVTNPSYPSADNRISSDTITFPNASSVKVVFSEDTSVYVDSGFWIIDENTNENLKDYDETDGDISDILKEEMVFNTNSIKLLSSVPGTMDSYLFSATIYPLDADGNVMNGSSSADFIINPITAPNTVGPFNVVVSLNQDNFEQDITGITDTVSMEVESAGVNAPNLDSGNLIPVYYDDTAEVWKKADSTNANNSWYDYDNKMWANAVMISNSTKRATYQSATVGTTITDSDISAFLVWIPRFKYRVWNITRQGGPENTYAYEAYTKGIDIVWENGTASTGNISCSYNVANSTPDTTLSDVCTVDGTIITPESGNTNFTNAWYTHPAFKFNESNKTGFWIGKFETTGSASVPTVLPDTTALVNQNVSTQFTTSKVFQTYGLSSSVDAHMLTNLEWGAMAYLTHSIYGLCDETSCRDAYINNSGNNLTGRSAGASISTFSTYGTYNYKGYSIDSSTGSTTGTKDATLVASSTGNITGVYDISGGAYEYVMANQVDSSNNFNPQYAGNSWNGSTTPSTFYYNAYSYGETYEDQTAFNRAYLGDATAETTGDTGNYTDAWKPGTGITDSFSYFVDPDLPWFIRGGYYYEAESGSFYFENYGGEDGGYSFRLSIS